MYAYSRLKKGKSIETLILESKSMDAFEKEYYISILEYMNLEQLNKLYNILEKESKKIEELEKKHTEEIRKINDRIIKNS